MKNAIIVVVVLVVGAAAFWGGGYYREQKIRANPRLLFSQGGPGGTADGREAFGGGRGGFGRLGGGQGGPGGTGGFSGVPILSGTLDEITDDELIMTTERGSVTVKINDETEYRQASEADAKDLQKKEEIIVEGERDDEGGLTAKAVIQ